MSIRSPAVTGRSLPRPKMVEAVSKCFGYASSRKVQGAGCSELRFVCSGTDSSLSTHATRLRISRSWKEQLRLTGDGPHGSNHQLDVRSPATSPAQYPAASGVGVSVLLRQP